MSVSSRHGTPTVVDVTLRDGGYLNDWRFGRELADWIVVELDRARLDVVEVGYGDDAPGLAIAASSPPEWLEALRPRLTSVRLAAMVRPTVERPDAVLSARRGLLDLIRIPTSIADPSAALRLAERVKAAELECSLNFTNISAFTERELEGALTRARVAGAADIAYLADSRGFFGPEEVAKTVTLARDAWRGPVGFHAHDNLGMAMANSLAAIEAGATLIDGSLKGYGAAGQNPDLGQLVAAVQVGATRADLTRIAELSASFELPMPIGTWNCYVLAGQKNLMQDWVGMLYERFGERTEEVLRAIPSEPYKTLDEVLERAAVTAGC